MRSFNSYVKIVLEKWLTLGLNQPMPEQVIIKIVGQNQYSVSLDLNSALGTIQRIQNTIDHIKDDLAVTQLEVDKSFYKEAGYQTKKAEYDVLAPLIETETDLNIID